MKFFFEELSALGNSPKEVYSEEAINSDIYIGLIGSDYGGVLESGISPTELDYDFYNKTHNDALIFIKDVKFRFNEIQRGLNARQKQFLKLNDVTEITIKEYMDML